MIKYDYQRLLSKLSSKLRRGDANSNGRMGEAYAASVAVDGEDMKELKNKNFFKDIYADIAPTQYEGVITKDIVIDGSIQCGSNLKIFGVVNGNISCGGNVDITNKVNGDISGKQINISGATITGNIIARDSVRHEGGVVTGRIEARNADIDGKVNGDISVGELLNIRKNAVINGDIHASVVSIAKKAVINGKLCVKSTQEE